MKKIIKLTETQLNKIVKRVLSEAYEGGLIQQGDAPCEIWCKVKLAKTGSNGDVVKMIQHLLAANGFNEEYVGGGMNSGCDGKWQHCDGKYRKHTKDAVLEFQKTHGNLKNDGIVGYDTLTVMCENLKPSKDNTGNFALCKKDCQCLQQQGPRDDEQLPAPPKLIDEKRWTRNECLTVMSCLRKTLDREEKTGTKRGEYWLFFLDCIGKIGKKIKPPIQKPNIGNCEGCPRVVAKHSINMSDDKAKFIQKCINSGCTSLSEYRIGRHT